MKSAIHRFIRQSLDYRLVRLTANGTSKRKRRRRLGFGKAELIPAAMATQLQDKTYKRVGDHDGIEGSARHFPVLLAVLRFTASGKALRRQSLRHRAATGNRSRLADREADFAGSELFRGEANNKVVLPQIVRQPIDTLLSVAPVR